MASTISVKVTNQLDVALTVYTTTTKPVSTPPSKDPADYAPIYTKLGSVPAKGENTLDTGALLSRLVLTRATDDFPVKLFVPKILGLPVQPVTVQDSDQAATTTAFKFYKDLVAQPYAPVALQFQEMILDVANIATLDSQVAALLSQSGYAGADLFGVNIVSYWAANSLFAWPGKYYCYHVSPLGKQGFLAPPVLAGTLVIAKDAAAFTASDGGPSYSTLAFANGQLASPGATPKSGLLVSALYRTMTWEGHPDLSGMFWVGNREGKQLILQPYEDTKMPWWVAGYNLAFLSFLTIQTAMMVQMAVHVLGGIANGLTWLYQNAGTLYGKLRSLLEDSSDAADPDAAAGDDVDPINVDVDVDTDVDTDTDVVTDTDNVTDTDTDVDIDIDIDIDDDVFAIIDVDVDVDVDIDVDVVTDTDNVTDTDTDVDVDVDVDTDVNVPTGAIQALLKKIGYWILTKGFPALIANAAIVGAMIGAQKLLAVWKTHDLNDLSPQETTGLGLLLNYMLNSQVPESTRWTTFADYIQQATPDTTSQRTLLASLLMFKNDTADAQAKAWNWPKSTAEQLEQQMAQYKGADGYKAYQMLAVYTYQSQPLPVKIAAAVAMRYLVLAG